jgi:hypothetical protein
MRKILFILFCSVVSLAVFGQTSRAVKGVVFDDKDNPIQGATISVVGSPDVLTQSDEKGHFEMNVSPYAKYVEATKEGYIVKSAEIDGTYLVFKLKVDKNYAKKKAKAEEMENAALLMQGQASRTVKGIVFDENDYPLSGATIGIVGSADASILSDKNGQFEINGSPYAKYVEASMEGYVSKSAEIDGTYLVFKLKIDKNQAKKKAQAEAEERAAAERAAKEKAQAEAEERAAAERVAKEERAAAERAAKEERAAAERAAKEKARAEAEERARIETQRKAKAKAERDSIAKIEAEKIKIAYAKKQSGFASIIDISYRMPIGNDFSSNLSLSYTAGYRLNNAIYIGAGLGLNYFMDNKPKHLTVEMPQGATLSPSTISIPVFAYFRANFINGRFSPFFALAAGYELAGKQTLQLDLYNVEYNTSALFVNPQLGINFRTTLTTSIYLAVGFQGYTTLYCPMHTGYSAHIKQVFTPGVDIHLGFTF